MYFFIYRRQQASANMLTRKSTLNSASECYKRKTRKSYKNRESCFETQQLSQTVTAPSDVGIGVQSSAPLLVDASTNTDPEAGPSAPNSASPSLQTSGQSSQEEEVGEENQDNPADNEAPSDLETDALRLLRMRQQGWLSMLGAIQPAFVPDRSALHYTTMVIRVAEVLQSHAIGEVIHNLANIRCRDGSPFLAGNWLEAPDNQIYKMFTALEKMNILTTRDGHFMEAILNAMRKPTAMHCVAKFHSMLNAPPALQQIPELSCSDRFLFSACDCLGSLSSICYEEIVRVKMVMCQYVQFEKYTAQFRGWKQLDAHNECAIFFQAPYAYFDQLFVMFFHEAGTFFLQNVVSLVFYLDDTLSLRMTPQDAFCLLHSMYESGCPGGVPVSRWYRAVSCVVEITGEATSYFVWVATKVEKDAVWRSDLDIVQTLHTQLVDSEKMPVVEDLKCVSLTHKEQCVSGSRTLVPWEIRLCSLQEIHSTVSQSRQATSEICSNAFRITFCNVEGNPQYITADCAVPKPYYRSKQPSGTDEEFHDTTPYVADTHSPNTQEKRQIPTSADLPVELDVPVHAKRSRLEESQD